MINEDLTKLRNYSTLSIYSKLDYEISGDAKICKRFKTTWTFSESFWKERYKSSITEIENLDEQDCRAMITSYKCNHNPMICVEGDCNYKDSIIEEYSWWADVTKVGYECIIHNKHIFAEKVDNHLHGFNCDAYAYSCKLTDGIMVWDHDVFHECPFKKIYNNVNFTSKHENIIISMEEKLVFDIIGTENRCDATIWITTEGLYLSGSENFDKKTIQNHDLESNKQQIGMMLSEEDFTEVVNVAEMRKNRYHECKLFELILKLYIGLGDKFFKVQDFKKNDIVLYVKDHIMYKPKCDSISVITIVNNTNKCYNEIPIIFNYNNKTRHGFLNNDLIIKDVSYEIECKNEINYVQLRNTKRLIKRDTNKYSVVDNDAVKLKQILYINSIIEENLKHSKIILEGFSSLKETDKTKLAEEIAGSWLISKNFNEQVKIKAKSIFKPVEDLFNEVSTKMVDASKIILIIIVVIIIIFILLICIKFSNCILKCCMCCRKRNNNVNNNRTDYIDLKKINEINKNGKNKKLIKKKENNEDTISLDSFTRNLLK